MNKIKLADLSELLQIHSPVKIEESDIAIINEVYTLEKKDFSQESLGKKISSVLGAEDIQRVFSIGDKGLRWKELLELVGDNITAKYPSQESKVTGGYILPTGDMPRVLLGKAVHKAANTSVKIIECNRYRSYDEQHNMLVEMVDNAYEHGNRFSRDKIVYLLWHKCPNSREILIIDEGTKEFSENDAHQGRIALAHGFGKDDDYSGLDLLNWNSRYHQFFGVHDESGAKKGTLLKIGLDRTENPEKLDEKCEYLGHRLLKINLPHRINRTSNYD